MRTRVQRSSKTRSNQCLGCVRKIARHGGNLKGKIAYVEGLQKEQSRRERGRLLPPRKKKGGLLAVSGKEKKYNLRGGVEVQTTCRGGGLGRRLRVPQGGPSMGQVLPSKKRNISF